MSAIQLKPSKKLTEQFEALKQRVITSLNGSASEGFVLAVTSCESGEGVTSVASNFAAMLASEGTRTNSKERSVLLMDGNLRRPALDVLFEQSREDNGNTAIVKEQKDLSGPVWRIYRANKNLDVLFARQAIMHPSSIFEAGWFSKSIKQLRERYDCVIIDCPPLKEASGTMLVAAKADAVALVIEAERVRYEAIQRTVSMLEDAGANILGVILNKRRYPIPNFIYKRL